MLNLNIGDILIRLLFILISIFFIFSACSSKPQKQIIISTNQWIGYAPLFYAFEKGELNKLNIKIITSVSLAEAADLYNIGKANMVTTTQHEYNVLKNTTHDIKAVILMDRSNGGDMILSNKSLDELKKSKKIDAYLEVDSINQEILLDFLKKNAISEDKINFINKDQRQIQDVKNDKTQDILIVTYSPYNIALEKKSFKEVASTKNINSIIVIDALCATNEIIKSDKKRLIQLKKIIDNAIKTIENDPEASYKVISKYLSGLSYKDYIDSLSLIKWINKPSKELLEYIQKYGYNKDDIIQ
ncbi:ABC transporter substrate-binding protein [Sulfurimonas autotrophica]|uniref:ABC-type nitrate/sulfonate/bicarbonate transport system periplasmic components n=1 Tax=Sulfurimonas autotrophica (strain ATCC BAA-671 / DSM 16294 / JCM 11897 / OK10) TaxID=563040 RepID=E0URN9_SULAO|nr:ABC transporter substrate-binding protein [Sulfurimonas autotrophica]ADN08983.1 ABC-type nitrate/sulfonate/bicarbonate transport system periplasmic components [Sulfurimonas autotrophica DSM 16294]